MHSSALHCRISYLFNLMVKSVPIQLFGHMQSLIKNLVIQSQMVNALTRKRMSSYSSQTLSQLHWKKQSTKQTDQELQESSHHSLLLKEELSSIAGSPSGRPPVSSGASQHLWYRHGLPQEETVSKATKISSISI